MASNPNYYPGINEKPLTIYLTIGIEQSVI